MKNENRGYTSLLQVLKELKLKLNKVGIVWGGVQRQAMPDRMKLRKGKLSLNVRKIFLIQVL